MFRKSALSCAVLALTLGLAACGGNDDNTSVAVGDTVALTVTGRLISFNRVTPGTLVGDINVTGLASGETLLGIDVRPATNTLYGLGSAGGIYTIEPSTGVATRITGLVNAAANAVAFTALSGTSFGVDFNPAADRLRVISNTGQNLRINVTTGETFNDLPISPAVASVSASGYTNAFPGAASTRLFNLNLTTNTVDLQDPPNNGTLVTGPTLGVTATAVNGFDIDARDNTGYAALTVGSTTSLYRINLTAAANAATLVAAIGGGEQIRGLALMQPLTVAGLTNDNRIVTFNPRTPNTLASNVAITGLNTGENILGMDVRPADGLLWALSSTGRLFTLNASTGAATFVASLFADPADVTAPTFTALDGSTALSVDFNPVPDRMRVITPAGQNLRINMLTGATNADLPINRASAAPTVLAAAYTNNFPGVTTTTLYNLEGNTDILTLQNPPNDGTLTNVGTGLVAGLDLSTFAGLDIAGGDNGLVLAALRSGTTGPLSLYSVNLTTGAAALYFNTSGNTALSQIGGATGPVLRDIAILRN
ncbi:MAG: DUF4394 domain-containing protein [Burkholderiaceae bacterium]